MSARRSARGYSKCLNGTTAHGIEDQRMVMFVCHILNKEVRKTVVSDLEDVRCNLLALAVSLTNVCVDLDLHVDP